MARWKTRPARFFCECRWTWPIVFTDGGGGAGSGGGTFWEVITQNLGFSLFIMYDLFCVFVCVFLINIICIF